MVYGGLVAFCSIQFPNSARLDSLRGIRVPAYMSNRLVWSDRAFISANGVTMCSIRRLTHLIRLIMPKARTNQKILPIGRHQVMTAKA